MKVNGDDSTSSSNSYSNSSISLRSGNAATESTRLVNKKVGFGDLYGGDEQRLDDIRSSINIGYESINSSENTISDIEYQNSLLDESKNNVDSIKSMAERARESIRTWQWNIYKKRFYLQLIAVILFILDLSLLVYMMRHEGRLY
jgi:hypothetical protein